jgi:hypothetical protein
MELFARVLLLFLATASPSSQAPPPNPPPAQTPSQPTQQPSPPPNPDGQIVTSVPAPSPDDDIPAPAHNPNATPAQRSDEAWTMLNNAVTDPKHTELRIQGVAALGTMGTNPRSIAKIAAAMGDKDLDVRTAAILAAGLTRSRDLTTNIRTLLDDKEPQVAFTAAVTLWKMNDRSGEDILLAVAEGDRSANPKMVNGTRQNISRSLRHPGSLARFGATQGAAMLLGPFGFGIGAIEYMRKNGSGNAARVTAIEQLGQERTAPVRNEIVAALEDKDPAVRAAAAKALGSYHDRSVSDDLFKLFDDSKAPVRLTAAAAYVNSTEPAAPRPPAPRTAAPRRKTGQS